MRALNLDFRRGRGDKKWAGVALLSIAGAAAFASGVHYSRSADALALAQAEAYRSGAAVRRLAIATRPRSDLQKVALEAKRAREIATQLKVPWNDLFASVEAAGTQDVALLSIESDTGKRRVKISAEARDLAAMLQYLRALGAQPGLADVYLQNHQVQQQDPQHPVRFVLGADWGAVRN